MNIEQHQLAFVQLGKAMKGLGESLAWPGFQSGLTEEEWDSFGELIERYHHHNGWFTADNIRQSLRAWGEALTMENLNQWLSPYRSALETSSQKTVSIICAGNIPMVGWHDVLSVLISGHKALIKLSSDDMQLIPALLNSLVKMDPAYADLFSYVEGKMTGFDAVIATGSNNSARYFNYYFASYPHIIRKSRTSVAILEGNESPEEIKALGHDIFDYFGLGCRNVTKLYVPKGYVIDRFFEGIYDFHDIVNHNKYANNYDYNKAVWLLNREDLLDNGFILLKKEPGKLACPTGSLYWEEYESEEQLRSELAARHEEIQCVVSRKDIPFGGAQCPMLWDYADGVDTLAFLSSL